MDKIRQITPGMYKLPETYQPMHDLIHSITIASFLLWRHLLRFLWPWKKRPGDA